MSSVTTVTATTATKPRYWYAKQHATTQPKGPYPFTMQPKRGKTHHYWVVQWFVEGKHKAKYFPFTCDGYAAAIGWRDEYTAT